MPINPLENLVFSIFDLLKGSIIITIPIFLLLLVGQKLRKRIESETKWNWLTSAFVATLIINFILLLVAYFFPLVTALQEVSIGQIPSVFAPSVTSLLGLFVFGVIWVGIVSVILSLLLMPLEFAGLFFYEFVSKKLKKQPDWVKLLATAYISAVFSSAVILFLVPEAITGFFYLLYFGL